MMLKTKVYVFVFLKVILSAHRLAKFAISFPFTSGDTVTLSWTLDVDI